MIRKHINKSGMATAAVSVIIASTTGYVPVMVFTIMAYAACTFMALQVSIIEWQDFREKAIARLRGHQPAASFKDPTSSPLAIPMAIARKEIEAHLKMANSGLFNPANPDCKITTTRTEL